MQQELDQLRRQVCVLKVLLAAIFVCMVIGWAVGINGIARSTGSVGVSADFDTITTRKLVVQSHAGDPWLVAEDSIAEPEQPHLGGTQLLKIGRRASSFNCWLDGRGGIQMWMNDGYDRERISWIVRGGPMDMASIELRNPEPDADVPFSAFSCNAYCREQLALGERVLD